MGTLVKTKYNTGDKVWLISNNKAISLAISGVSVTVELKKECQVEYILHFESGWIDEEKLFESKKELLESL